MDMTSSKHSVILNVTCGCGKSVPIPERLTMGYELAISVLEKRVRELEEENKLLKNISKPISEDNETSKDEELRITLTPAQERAYQSYVITESQLTKCTDHEAYDWLVENGIQDYDLPSFETWQRYVRKGRKYYGTQKNESRKGRTGRSIVNSSQIETLSEVSNQFEQKAD